MNNETVIPFPRYIDRPKMIGIFEIDEVLVGLSSFMIVFLVGFFTGAQSAIVMPLGLVFLFATSFMVKKYKKNYADNFLFHLIYKKGFYHPVLSDARLNKRLDIKNGSKIIPTGYAKYFYE